MGTCVHTSDENRKVEGNHLRGPGWESLPVWKQIAWLPDDAGKRLGMQSLSDLRFPSYLEPFSMSHFSSDLRSFRGYTGHAWREKARR